jgi:DNA replicative helicase MCM subunit Mcm2 (Cdc46/Mcm family)
MFLALFSFSKIMVTLIKVYLGKLQSLLRLVMLVSLIGMICGHSLVAIAAPQLAAMGAIDNALDQRQRILDEKLKLDPTKLRYRGLEYVQFQPQDERLSDVQIKSTIKSDINSDIVVAVATGSVQVFGNVANIDVAREVVTQIKAIPGVREVMFDLGLEMKAE